EGTGTPDGTGHVTDERGRPKQRGRESAERVGVAGIARYRSLEVRDRPAIAVWSSLGILKPAPEVRVVRVEVRGGGARDHACEVPWSERRGQRGRDGPCHLALNREDVGQIAVECLRPQGSFAGRVNQLRDDPKPLARAADAPFHDVRDTEVGRDRSWTEI